ncbi:MAG TPA: phosphatase PAP2 family protein [Solirubrobacteraceae bacterium]|nr:phosphatase PAP2 family protein [Solirubrobacteraceae bacterium]
MAIRARWALAGAGVCVMLLIATWFAAFHVAIFRSADLSTYVGFMDLHRHGAVETATSLFVRLCDPGVYVLWAPVVVVIALVRGRPQVALGVAVLLLGANVTTELVKHLLPEPQPAGLLDGWFPVRATLWPSGHSTAAMAAVLGLMLASPGRLRPLVAALGAAFAVAVGYSLVAIGTHFPADVFGGYLVAAAWALVVVAALSAAERRWPSGATVDPVSMRAALAPQAAVVIAGVALVGLVALTRPHDVLAYMEAHKQLMAVAAAIATLSVGLSTGVLLSLRR